MTKSEAEKAFGRMSSKDKLDVLKLVKYLSAKDISEAQYHLDSIGMELGVTDYQLRMIRDVSQALS